jgi:hypothetical protein
VLKNSFYAERMEAASIRGRDVHLACEDLDKGQPDWWSDDPEIGPYVAAYAQFKRDFSFKPLVIEKPCFHEVYRYAGTPDRFGQLQTRNGPKNVTVDLKAVSKVGEHTALQLAAYNLFCDDREDRDCLAVQLKKTGKYAIHECLRREQDEKIFLAFLTVALWKDKNHGTKLFT